MKKFYIIVALLFLQAVFLGPVYAQETIIAPGNPDGASSPSSSAKPVTAFSLQNPLNNKFSNLGELVNAFADIAAYVLVIVAVLMIIFTGFQFITAQGKPERLKELGTRMGYIVIGVAIIIGARIIVNVIINTLASTGAVNKSVIENARDAANPTSPINN